MPNERKTDDVKPLLFISHKEQDRKIGSELSSWIRTITGGSVDVYFSSDDDFQGPRNGKSLNAELKSALARTGLVILLYTSQGRDWDWCMWECGVATDPNSRDTDIVVFQCLDDEPTVFKDTVRVRLSSERNVIGFAKQFSDPGFYPARDSPLSQLSEKELEKSGKALHKTLLGLVPTPDDNWSAWPFIRIQLTHDNLHAIDGLESDQQKFDAIFESLKSDASVVSWSPALPALFGCADLTENSPFLELIDRWAGESNGATDHWIHTLAQQIVDGSKKHYPNIKTWARFRPVEGDAEYVVGVGRIKQGAAGMTYDCYFYRLVDVPLVRSLMNSRANMYCKDLSEIDPANTSIVDVISEMEDQKRTRLPLLEDGLGKYVIHARTIDRFVRGAVLDGRDCHELTLANILDDDDMRAMFEQSHIVVSNSATLDETLIQMRAKDGIRCKDVFVTETGDESESLQGWLTDRDVINAG